MPKSHKQSDFFEPKKAFSKKSDRFGGNQRTTRASRQFRPVATKSSMHLLLRSLRAKGSWSFRTPQNTRQIEKLVKSHALRNSVQILSWVNAGNHLHIHLKVKSTTAYKRFVRGLTGAVTLAVTGANKTKKLTEKFWTQTPFTRFVHGLKDLVSLEQYFDVNRIEGFGFKREYARLYLGEISKTREKFRRLAHR